MRSYAIGELAEKILAVKIGRDGAITPYVRRRDSSGRMIDVPNESRRIDQGVAATDFVVRVRDGDSGVVALAPPGWYYRYTVAVIPLGPAEPFCDSEVESEPSSDVLYSGPDEVRFHLENGKLTWESGNASGEAVINDTYPELLVTLRLPPGCEGEFEFVAPVSAHGSERTHRLLSVA